MGHGGKDVTVDGRHLDTNVFGSGFKDAFDKRWPDLQFRRVFVDFFVAAQKEIEIRNNSENLVNVVIPFLLSKGMEVIWLPNFEAVRVALEESQQIRGAKDLIVTRVQYRWANPLYAVSKDTEIIWSPHVKKTEQLKTDDVLDKGSAKIDHQYPFICIEKKDSYLGLTYYIDVLDKLGGKWPSPPEPVQKKRRTDAVSS